MSPHRASQESLPPRPPPAFAGPTEDDGERARRASSRLTRTAGLLVVAGAVATTVGWLFSSELGAAILAGSLTLLALVVVVRQALLAEQEG